MGFSKRKLSLVIVAIIFAITIMSAGLKNVYAEENSYTLVGDFYEYPKNNNDTAWGSEDTWIVSTMDYLALGKFEVRGDIVEDDTVRDIYAFIANSGNARVRYVISNDRLLNNDLTKWHIDQSEGYAICIYTSFDDDGYVMDCFDEHDDFTSDTTKDLYETKEVQLINGCYYMVTVDYVLRRKTGTGLFGKDKFEYRSEEEIYNFYVESTEKDLASTSSDKPRKNLGELVNTGHDKGYSGDNKIDNKDPHYGWNIGSFFINGYSSENVDDNGVPIILKNVGDKVTLWFNLEQDIQCLNGDDKLRVSWDKNGYDQEFGIEKMDLGYGALMILYTDEDGVKHEPIVYTDYLYASTKTGADKRVYLFEEGDYEVHLDYEIVKDGVVDSYNDYQISFKFKVRNGNCMVFPFDSKTGAELVGNAHTENGFRIDRAKSRYLSVNVMYEKIVKNVDGTLSKDTRYNRPVTDNNDYTEEGIYTIDVVNVNTNPQLQTEKTIYVGNDGVIKALINGKSFDELNDLIKKGYKIADDGSIYNSECEIYPVNVSNGMDVKNDELIEKGFYLDYDKSMYLDITIKYYELSVGKDGLGVMNEKYSVPAKEGQNYTDEGIYVIEAVNNKTSSELRTEKRIFVGNNSFLKGFAQSGQSLEEINEMIAEGYEFNDEGVLVAKIVEENESATDTLDKEEATISDISLTDDDVTKTSVAEDNKETVKQPASIETVEKPTASEKANNGWIVVLICAVVVGIGAWLWKNKMIPLGSHDVTSDIPDQEKESDSTEIIEGKKTNAEKE